MTVGLVAQAVLSTATVVLVALAAWRMSGGSLTRKADRSQYVSAGGPASPSATRPEGRRERAIAVDAGTFAVSVAGPAVIRYRTGDDAPPPEAAGAHRPRIRDDFRAGLAFLWRTPVLRALMILLTVVSFLSLGMTEVFVYDVRHVLGQGDRVVGLVLGAAGVGTVIGAAATSRLRGALGFGWCWLGSYVLCGGAVAWLGVSENVTAMAALCPVYMFGMAVGGICSLSLRQEVTPDRLLGRVTAAFWTVQLARPAGRGRADDPGRPDRGAGPAAGRRRSVPGRRRGRGVHPDPAAPPGADAPGRSTYGRRIAGAVIGAVIEPPPSAGRAGSPGQDPLQQEARCPVGALSGCAIPPSGAASQDETSASGGPARRIASPHNSGNGRKRGAVDG